MNEQRKGNWISVKESYPESWTFVLVVYDSGRIDFASKFDSEDKFINEVLYGKVTHWQPLPEPPGEN